MTESGSDWDTPYGKNVRYTIRIHVIGQRIGDIGSMRPAPSRVVRRVVTPFGELTAAALAATAFEREEPAAVWQEINLIKAELDFDIEDADYWDDASRSR